MPRGGWGRRRRSRSASLPNTPRGDPLPPLPRRRFVPPSRSRSAFIATRLRRRLPPARACPGAARGAAARRHGRGLLWHRGRRRFPRLRGEPGASRRSRVFVCCVCVCLTGRSGCVGAPLQTPNAASRLARRRSRASCAFLQRAGRGQVAEPPPVWCVTCVRPNTPASESATWWCDDVDVARPATVADRRRGRAR